MVLFCSVQQRCFIRVLHKSAVTTRSSKELHFPITPTTPEPPVTSEFMHVPEGAGATYHLRSGGHQPLDGARLQDAEPVQQQRSGGRQRQQRRPAVHSPGAVFHPHRHILRGCVRVGRHSRASRNCDVLGLNRETEAY